MDYEHMTGYLFFREMYQYLRSKHVTPESVTYYAKRSKATINRYLSAPGTRTSIPVPPTISDNLIQFVTLIDRVDPWNPSGLTEDQARNCRDWLDVARAGIVPRCVLADIAGTDIYRVGWIGYAHPQFGIVPTADMVSRARAAEALAHRPRVA